MRSCLVVAVLLVSALRAQSSDPESDFWHEIPSSPLKFDIPAKDPAYEEMQPVKIRPLIGRVIAYDLGCVTETGGVAYVSQVVRSWRFTWKVEDQYFPRHVLRITAIPCVRQGQRLAVVRVQFEDGASWQLPTRPPADTPK